MRTGTPGETARHRVRPEGRGQRPAASSRRLARTDAAVLDPAGKDRSPWGAPATCETTHLSPQPFPQPADRADAHSPGRGGNRSRLDRGENSRRPCQRRRGCGMAQHQRGCRQVLRHIGRLHRERQRMERHRAPSQAERQDRRRQSAGIGQDHVDREPVGAWTILALASSRSRPLSGAAASPAAWQPLASRRSRPTRRWRRRIRPAPQATTPAKAPAATRRVAHRSNAARTEFATAGSPSRRFRCPPLFVVRARAASGARRGCLCSEAPICLTIGGRGWSHHPGSRISQRHRMQEPCRSIGSPTLGRRDRVLNALRHTPRSQGTMGRQPRCPRGDPGVGPSGVPERGGRDAQRRNVFAPLAGQGNSDPGEFVARLIQDEVFVQPVASAPGAHAALPPRRRRQVDVARRPTPVARHRRAAGQPDLPESQTDVEPWRRCAGAAGCIGGDGGGSACGTRASSTSGTRTRRANASARAPQRAGVRCRGVPGIPGRSFDRKDHDDGDADDDELHVHQARRRWVHSSPAPPRKPSTHAIS